MRHASTYGGGDRGGDGGDGDRYGDRGAAWGGGFGMSGSMLATAWSLHLPGVRLGAALAERVGAPDGAWAYEDAPAPDKAAVLLGRKGLLYKEPSTRLALCAVHRALGLPAGRRPDRPLSPTTAVVACSNLGNVETVARVTRTIATEGGQAVSVLDAPNVSSNIVASTVALWFGFGGPNLMVCSGATAGLDGLWLAGLLLRARRAERVVLVGAEPADDVAAALRHGASAGESASALGGAACVVLERQRPAVLASSGQALIELVPGGGRWPRRPRITIGGAARPREWHMVSEHQTPLTGDYYGAHGVVALALAAHLAVDEGYGVVGVRCDGEDGGRGEDGYGGDGEDGYGGDGEDGGHGERAALVSATRRPR